MDKEIKKKWAPREGSFLYPEGIRRRNSKKLKGRYLNETKMGQGKIPGLIKYYVSQHPLSGLLALGCTLP